MAHNSPGGSDTDVSSHCSLTSGKKLSVVLAGVTLWKTTVGTGIVAMSKAAGDTGFVLFGILVLLISLTSHTGCVIFARSLDVIGRSDVDISDLGFYALGRKGWWLAVTIVFFDSWGAAIGYYKVLGGIIATLLEKGHTFEPGSIWLDQRVIILCLCAIIYPITLYKRITELSWISTSSSAALLGFVCALFIKASLDGHWEEVLNAPSFRFETNSLLALPVIAFAYDCQINVFPIYRELDCNVGEKAGMLGKASLMANLLAALSYFAVGLFGFALYGYDTSSNILTNLPSTTPFLIIKYAYVVSIILTFPFLVFECSGILMQRVFHVRGRKALASTQLVVVGSSALVAALCNSVYTAFAYVGATTAISFMAVLPPLFYLAILQKEFGITPWSPYPKEVECGCDGDKPLIDSTFANKSLIPSPCEVRISAVLLMTGILAIPAALAVTAFQSMQSPSS